MKSGLVSVVVVTHDNWPDLELAIQSALCQSYKSVEVIVVDNDSSDGTAEEVRARFGQRVSYHRQANSFDGGGRNTGYARSAGEFVQFLDGDDFLAPDKIEKQVAVLRADATVDVAYGDFRVFGSAGVVLEEGNARDFDDLLLALLTPEGDGAGLLVHSALFRRSALDKIGPWDVTIPRCDQDYWLRAASRGCKFRYCPRSLCFYQRRPGQMSSHELGVRRDMEMTWAKALQYLPCEPYNTILRRRLARLRFVLAVRGGAGGRQASIAALRLARQTSPETVPPLALAAGLVLVTVPGGHRVARVGALRPLRRLARRLLRVDDSTPILTTTGTRT